MPVLTSDTANTRAGDISMTLEDAGISGADTTFDLYEIGDLKIMHEIPTNSESQSDLEFIIGEWDISAFDECGDGNSLYDKLDSATEISAIVTYTDKTGSSSDFRYTIKPRDISYDYDRRVTTFELSAIDSDLFNEQNSGEPSVNSICTSGSRAFDHITQDISQQDAVTAYDFVTFCLEDIDRQTTELAAEAANTVILRSYKRDSDTSEDILNTGSSTTRYDFFVIDNTTDGSAYFNFARIAGVNGAIFGHAFGTSYYVCRPDDTDKVTLEEDDFREFRESLELPFYSSATNAMLEVSNSGDVVIGPYTETVQYGRSNVDTISISFDFQDGYLGQATGAVVSGKSEILEDDSQNLKDDIVRAGLDAITAYSGAGLTNYFVFSVGSKKGRLEFEILGVNNLYPWQCFELGTSFEAKFQGNIYRPSKMRYNFNEDVVSGDAYLIG